MPDDNLAATRGSLLSEPSGTRDTIPGATVRQAEFEDFVRTERSTLIWFLMSQHGAAAHEAEEAVHLAMIKAWQKWETITHPRQWVYTVAAREYFRSSPKADTHRAHDVVVEEISERPEPSYTPSAADRVVFSEQERLVCAELAKLPPVQRQVAELRYRGYSNREIADLLGVDPSAVRHNVLRARNRLRHLLDLIQEDAG
ncbi:RNA polymerase sigma factor [Actinosynnema sp. ALI-1.44]|uniref:RNA polymerase sigma factor n=1 Tax=Actinosynnema sp. ALI-1.44 TaxID=1933779 RepID=UPI00143DEFBC|nr:sigma-70 family RNA polymerase sigma factor [Actinosynnema sp. ALI-1.44]